MKKAFSLFLVLCLSLCLCSCGKGSTDDTNAEDKGDATPAIGDPAAKDLFSGWRYVHTSSRGGKTRTSEEGISVKWEATGAKVTGYDLDSDDGRSEVQAELVLDDQKRPVTLKSVETRADGRVDEDEAHYEYLSERKIKKTYSDSENYFITEYDSNGNLIRKESADSVTTYVYDAHGNCTQEKRTYKEEEWEDSEINTTYTYDASGKMVRSVEIDEEGWETQTQYLYYPNGNVMLEIYVSSSGDAGVYFRPYNSKDMIWLTFFLYRSVSRGERYGVEKDEQGRIVKLTGSSLYGETKTATFSYDAQGRLTKYIDFDGQEKVWEYDAQNRLVKFVRRSDSDEYVCLYTYDDKGRLIKDEDTNTDGSWGKVVMEYNEAGVVCKLVSERYNAPSESWPEGYTYSSTIEATYVENAQCPVDDPWRNMVVYEILG